MRKINTILFDLGKTLVEYRVPPYVLIYEVLRRFGCDISPFKVKAALEETEEAFNPLKRKIKKSAKGRFTYIHIPKDFWFEYNGYLLKKLGIGFRMEIAEDLFNTFYSVDNVTIYDDVLPTLKRLREEGYKMGLVSNNTEFAKLIVKFYGFEKFFNTIIISYEVGYEKPDAEIFKTALKNLGSNPSSTVYIGDDYFLDVLGARKVDITPILLDRKHKFREIEREVIVINTLSPLPILLKNI